MRPSKISTNFVPLTDSSFNVKALSILLSMENNPNFTNPVPPLDTIRQLLSKYDEALTEAIGKNTVSIAIKNETRKKLEHELGRLAYYVMYVADDDEPILVSSGYDLVKKPSAQQVAKPGSVNLRSGINSGELISSVKAVKGTKYYLHEITPDPMTDNSIWQVNNCSRCKFTFKKLRPGQMYWVRVAALGTGLQKAYSYPGYKYVQ